MDGNYDLLNLFREKDFVRVCAPMVRYSKFQFRALVREYGCDLCFTPMILADSFCQSQKARDNEFVRNSVDHPLVIQFAAKKVDDFVDAAVLASPYCNGVDLNCGCPQRWAKSLGIGCIMLDNPELIYDIVRQCRNRISKPFTVSVKMRILSDIRKTIGICQQLEHCGIDFLSVHGRTPAQKSDDVNIEALRIVNDSVTCPVIANGGVKSLEDARKLHKYTNSKGIMVANSILTNPAIFSGVKETPVDCVQKWVDICFNSVPELNLIESEVIDSSIEIPHKTNVLTYQCFHHHLVFMLEKLLPKRIRKTFNNLQSFSDVLEFLNVHLDIKPKVLSREKQEKYKPLEMFYKSTSSSENIIKYDYDSNNGKFFKSKVNIADEDTFISDLFVEK